MLPRLQTGRPSVRRARRHRAAGTLRAQELDVHWDPALESLLEGPEGCDVPVQWACRIGVYCSCETGLTLGTLRYRPDPVEPPANGNLLVYCSQPYGDIVLDLKPSR